MTHSSESNRQSRRSALAQDATSRRDPIPDIATLIAECDWERRSASFILRRRGVDGPDLVVSDQGTIFVFYPRSAAAQGWWHDNVGSGDMTYGRNFVVEHRFVQGILNGLRRDGFVIVRSGGQDA